MNRGEFDHAIRAAGSILDVEEILVIGSQAVHRSIGGQLPEAALRSVGVDVAAVDDDDGSQPTSSMDRSSDISHRPTGEWLHGVSICATCGSRRRRTTEGP